MEEHADSFRAMNTGIDVVVFAPSRPVNAFLTARLLFDQQEQRFSRFRHDSVLSRLNGGECVADPFLDSVLDLAFAAYDETGGIFNPCILPQLEAAGYDRSFDDLERTERTLDSRAAADPRAILHRTPDGWIVSGGRIDLGGIVKGWTVDLAAEALSNETGDVLINAGGDLRVTGSDGEGPGWALGIERPFAGGSLPFRWGGAVATSTTLRRRWSGPGNSVRHHLIDPRTGEPAASDFCHVTVLGSETWRSEVWAKSIVIGGASMAEAAVAADLAVYAVRNDGHETFFGNWPS